MGNEMVKVGSFAAIFLLTVFLVMELDNFRVLDNISEGGITILRALIIMVPVVAMAFMARGK